jgi:hypothetical protein
MCWILGNNVSSGASATVTTEVSSESSILVSAALDLVPCPNPNCMGASDAAANDAQQSATGRNLNLITESSVFVDDRLDSEFNSQLPTDPWHKSVDCS